MTRAGEIDFDVGAEGAIAPKNSQAKGPFGVGISGEWLMTNYISSPKK